MIGVDTILADDPLLTVSLPGMEHRSPVRVVADDMLRTPPSAQVVLTSAQIPTWIIALETASADAERQLSDAGVEVLRVPERAGHGDISNVLRRLADRGITRVMVEGPPSLAASLLASRNVDELLKATFPFHPSGGSTHRETRALRRWERDFAVVRAQDCGAGTIESLEKRLLPGRFGNAASVAPSGGISCPCSAQS
jgi:riboflavin biosynthesis pyrimidine reductase